MTAFQRRHYQALANVVKTFPVADRVKFVMALDDMFKADNDTYNSHKFVKACEQRNFFPPSECKDILRERGLL